MAKRSDEAVSSTVSDFLGLGKPQAAPPPAPEPPPDKKSGGVVGVYLKDTTRDAFQQLADKHNISRSAAMRYALTWWLSEHEAGHVEIEFEQSRTPRFRD